MSWDQVQQTDHGFTWGAVEVERSARLPAGRGAVLTLRGEGGAEIEVWVSEKGRRFLVVTKAGRFDVADQRPKTSGEFADG